ncbi:peroxisomal acyl-coenzyme A oxidase 3-like [Leptopilina heterotoma]|uniref:peroxisomal acyl-coenzyme A oxidase 3-like n=1 Tax=Leptopilina heterotoma TaxID=63436 RepID=UPI001CA8DF0C|nr:peroxisomal acyl-coenzyme A oxidase 3-like [Leptopilina heterotoma]XP_043467953.1 peroxisomal acyl-coenzyme A oxidase 3-like [Leptopilina heterotoma]
MELIHNLPNGPLDEYRKRASFNWKSLKLHLEGEDFVQSQENLWNFIKNRQEFQYPKESLNLDDTRKRAYRQVMALSKIKDDKFGTWAQWLRFYDASIGPIRRLSQEVVPEAIRDLGTERHRKLISKFIDGTFLGCLCFTEIAHGSNLKGLKTSATYNVATESFILHTPNFEDAKCWSGLLGKTATHALLYAQLITPDGIKHGLHPFIVPIRDAETRLPLAGLIIGDMGEKIGLNGLDNGFMLFKNYSLPREYLLNKIADVSKDGIYSTSVKKQDKRFAKFLSPLSTGRVGITLHATMFSRLALTIATRYCAVRRQFGPNEKEEVPVIEYQVQQGRLFPHIATLYAWTIFGYYILRMSDVQTKKSSPAENAEMHALISATKPLSTWSAQAAIQDCREACGGHGYLKASRLGEMRDSNDPSATYEGENTVLIQQASNWLLNQWDNFKRGKGISTPLGTAGFIKTSVYILSQKFHATSIEETLKLDNLLIMHKWLVCYHLKKTYEQMQFLRKQGMNSFEIRNNSQMFFARTLSLVYAEHAVVKIFMDRINDPVFPESERCVLRKLCALFSAWCLEKRMSDFYAGGFANANSKLDVLLREGIVSLNKDLLSEVVALIDVLAPPDFVVNSPLGMSDGEIYKHLEETFFKDPKNFERPSWWMELKSNL